MNQPLSILFVDDEPRILEAIQRMLRPMRERWRMRFVSDGQAALAELEREPAEVVVTDMRMPGLSGADVLERVRERWPGTVRIVLSGQADQGLVARVIHCAHRFLAKPCDPETLKQAIERSCALRAQVGDPELQRLAGGVHALPSLPALHHELIAVLSDGARPVADAGAIVARDPAMCAKLLQVANSGFFGLRRQIAEPGEAAAVLGVDALRALVLGAHAFTAMPAGSVLAQTLWGHSVAVAGACRAIARVAGLDKPAAEAAFMAGMLHDVGQTLLESQLTQSYVHLVRQAEAHQVRVEQAEEALLKTSHGPMGAYLLGMWGIADDIVEAVAYHHHPARAGRTTVGPLTVVHVAEALIEDAAGSRIDRAYLAAVGVDAQLAAWREVVAEVVGSAA